MKTILQLKKQLRVIIVSDHKEKAHHLLQEFGEFFIIVDRDPDIVISYGGDGMFFKAEFLYPGVPKLYLKHSYIGKLANKKDNETILEHVVRGDYEIVQKTKLEVQGKNVTLTALGDILVHNKNPRTAIRCKIYLDDELIQEEDIIGDGILVTTQIGSTGYYKSITRSYFENDGQIGLAFNNAIEQINHVVLNKTRVIRVVMTRGVAQVFADNQDNFFEVGAEEDFCINVSRMTASIITIN